jgi:hypothetical protein
MKTFPLRIDEELHRALKHAALDEGMTLHDWIIHVLKQGLHQPRYSIQRGTTRNETTRAHSDRK